MGIFKESGVRGFYRGYLPTVRSARRWGERGGEREREEREVEREGEILRVRVFILCTIKWVLMYTHPSSPPVSPPSVSPPVPPRVFFVGFEGFPGQWGGISGH